MQQRHLQKSMSGVCLANKHNMLAGRRRDWRWRAPIVHGALNDPLGAHCTRAVKQTTAKGQGKDKPLLPQSTRKKWKYQGIALHFIFLPQETSPQAQRRLLYGLSMMRALALVPENIENFLPPLVIASAVVFANKTIEMIGAGSRGKNGACTCWLIIVRWKLTRTRSWETLVGWNLSRFWCNSSPQLLPTSRLRVIMLLALCSWTCRLGSVRIREYVITITTSTIMTIFWIVIFCFCKCGVRLSCLKQDRFSCTVNCQLHKAKVSSIYLYICIRIMYYQYANWYWNILQAHSSFQGPPLQARRREGSCLWKRCPGLHPGPSSMIHEMPRRQGMSEQAE